MQLLKRRVFLFCFARNIQSLENCRFYMRAFLLFRLGTISIFHGYLSWKIFKETFNNRDEECFPKNQRYQVFLKSNILTSHCYICDICNTVINLYFWGNTSGAKENIINFLANLQAAELQAYILRSVQGLSMAQAPKSPVLTVHCLAVGSFHGVCSSQMPGGGILALCSFSSSLTPIRQLEQTTFSQTPMPTS